MLVLDMGKEGPEVSKIKVFQKVPESAYKDMFENPNTFQDAWNHPDPWQKTRWQEAILKEFKKMEIHKVWKKFTKSDMPKTRRCVKCKWIFEKK